MKVSIHIDNRTLILRGLTERRILGLLDKATSYRVLGAFWTTAFRERRWDGREHLLVYSRAKPLGYRLPRGLLADLRRFLLYHDVEHEFVDRSRPAPEPSSPIGWTDEFELRDYQAEAVEAILGSVDKCHGIIKSPIRSGKTFTAAYLIHKLNTPTIFFVPSKMLLHQTASALERFLGREIGIIGDGQWAPAEVTVATVQSLVTARKKDRKKYVGILGAFGLVVNDECHHLKGKEWREVTIDFDAKYKVGLSATAYLDNSSECERGVIWLKAATGGIVIDIPTSRLIEEGYLLRPKIELYRIREPDMMEEGWSGEHLKKAITANPVRNAKIADIAFELVVDRGLKVLIISNRLDQVEALRQALGRNGVSAHTITGEDKTLARKRKVADFVAGRIDVLLGTVFGEGVDLPSIEAVINAEGGKDVKATIQRMRNLTPDPGAGKTEAVFVDFVDFQSEYTVEHSWDRVTTYRSEPAFHVRIVE